MSKTGDWLIEKHEIQNRGHYNVKCEYDCYICDDLKRSLLPHYEESGE